MKKNTFKTLAKQIAGQMPGFAVEGAMMFATPMDHTLRGIYFEGSSFSPDVFYVWVFFLPLYVPVKHIHFTLGRRLCDNGERWSLSDSTLEENLCLAIQREALPFLYPLRSMEGVIEAISTRPEQENPYVKEALAYTLARTGPKARSIALLRQLIQSLDVRMPWQREMAERAEMLESKLVGDSADADRQLDMWEMESMTNLGLNNFS